MSGFICSLFVLLHIFGANALIRLPLQRNWVPDLDAFNTYVLNLRSYHTDTLHLKNNGYAHYNAEIALGTPEQRVNVVVDTATPGLWMTSGKFDGRKSSTYNDSSLVCCKIKRPYGGGTLGGENKKDVLQLGEAKIFEQNFNIVNERFEGKNFDGILGLAYSKNSSVCGPEATPVENLVSQKGISGVFAFRFNKNTYNLAPKHIGDVVFGGIDSKFVDEGSLDYIPVSKKSNWHIALNNVSTVNGLPVCRGGCPAVVDSSSPVIAGPVEEVRRLYEAINGGCRDVSETYEVPCHNVGMLPALSFWINGKEYVLDGKDYVLKFPGPTCVTALVGVNLPDNLWLLGYAFMKNYYTVFDQDNDRVAFGELKADYDEEEMIED